MMYYIGLGGIGSKRLKTYANMHPEINDNCFYLDIDLSTKTFLDSDDHFYYIENNHMQYSSFRVNNKHLFLLEVYRNRLQLFFNKLIHDEDASVMIFATSFSNFSSGCLHELIHYLMGIMFLRYHKHTNVSAIIYSKQAYDHKNKYLKNMNLIFENNENAFLEEYRNNYKNNQCNALFFYDETHFNYNYTLYLIHDHNFQYGQNHLSQYYYRF